MTTYSYAQLESLWVQAGGSSALAPVMAAIAEAESGGNSAAYNQSGASGLWQILGAVNPGDQSSLFNPQVNAKEAVAKYKTQGLDAWTTYTGGQYKQFLQSNVAPSASTSQISQALDNQNVAVNAGSLDSAGVPATPDSTGTSGVLSQASGLLKDVATVLDYVFGMFGRGQGWRLMFTLITIAAAYMSYKVLVGSSGPHVPIPVPV